MNSTNSPMEQLGAFAIVFVCGVLASLVLIQAIAAGRKDDS